LKTIEQIDVLWLKGRAIKRAFEVEHSTSIYSGILRMADLLALQPNMDIRLHIVAPIPRRGKVFHELGVPYSRSSIVAPSQRSARTFPTRAFESWLTSRTCLICRTGFWRNTRRRLRTELGASEGVRAAFRLSRSLEELHGAGFAVFGGGRSSDLREASARLQTFR
jgi:hypothetical protein